MILESTLSPNWRCALEVLPSARQIPVEKSQSVAATVVVPISRANPIPGLRGGMGKSANSNTLTPCSAESRREVRGIRSASKSRRKSEQLTWQERMVSTPLDVRASI